MVGKNGRENLMILRELYQCWGRLVKTQDLWRGFVCHLFEDSTVSAGFSLAIWERGVFRCLCDFWMGEHFQLFFQDKTRRLYMSSDHLTLLI